MPRKGAAPINEISAATLKKNNVKMEEKVKRETYPKMINTLAKMTSTCHAIYNPCHQCTQSHHQSHVDEEEPDEGLSTNAEVMG